MGGQIGLFDGVKLEEQEPMTTVRVSKRVAQILLRRKRRQAIKRLMESCQSWRVRISTSALMMLAAGISGWII